MRTVSVIPIACLMCIAAGARAGDVSHETSSLATVPDRITIFTDDAGFGEGIVSITSTSTQKISWSVSEVGPGLYVSPARGTLWPGQTATIMLSMAPATDTMQGISSLTITCNGTEESIRRRTTCIVTGPGTHVRPRVSIEGLRRHTVWAGVLFMVDQVMGEEIPAAWAGIGWEYWIFQRHSAIVYGCGPRAAMTRGEVESTVFGTRYWELDALYLEASIAGYLTCTLKKGHAALYAGAGAGIGFLVDAMFIGESESLGFSIETRSQGGAEPFAFAGCGLRITPVRLEAQIRWQPTFSSVDDGGYWADWQAEFGHPHFWMGGMLIW